MKLSSVLLAFTLFNFLPATAQNANYGKLQNGDILFQDLDCGPLCDAIEMVTQSYGGRHFSHLGLVALQKDSVFVIEAIGAEVKKTPIHVFLSRSKNELLLGRLKRKYRHLANASVSIAMSKLAMSYDDEFLYNNGKYYCSELIYDAFKEANSNIPFFELMPMTFKIPHSDSFFPVWIQYYKDLNKAIPEGDLGINPGGISRSKKLKIYRYQK